MNPLVSSNVGSPQTNHGALLGKSSNSMVDFPACHEYRRVSNACERLWILGVRGPKYSAISSPFLDFHQPIHGKLGSLFHRMDPMFLMVKNRWFNHGCHGMSFLQEALQVEQFAQPGKGARTPGTDDTAWCGRWWGNAEFFSATNLV